MSDDTPTSFDAFVHEHALNGSRLEIARMAFKLGVAIGRKQGAALQPQPKPYHAVLDKDTVPGEFR